MQIMIFLENYFWHTYKAALHFKARECCSGHISKPGHKYDAVAPIDSFLTCLHLVVYYIYIYHFMLIMHLKPTIKAFGIFAYCVFYDKEVT